MTESISTFALPHCIVDALAKKDLPFESDVDYFSFIEAISTAKYMCFSFRTNMTERLFTMRSNDFASVDSQVFIKGADLASRLQDLVTNLESIKRERLTLSSFSPRLERLFERLEADEHERNMISFLMPYSFSDIMVKESTGLSYRRGLGLSFFVFAKVINVPLLRVTEFYSMNSKWVLEGILISSSNPRQDVPPIVESAGVALLGLSLTSAQFLAIESQVLQSIISNEEGFEQTAAGKCSDLTLSSKKYEDISPRDSKQPSTFNNMESLYELLKKEESQSTKDVSSDAPPSSESNESPSGTQDSTLTVESKDEIKNNDDLDLSPYLNDLSYLQDQMNLTNCVVKICRLTRSIEEIGDMDEDDTAQYRYGRYEENDMVDQLTGEMLSKEQAVQKKQSKLKKLTQKERVIRGKISHRLSATKAKGGWYPRFERLIDALDLCTFEKFIVLHLIGTVIAPAITDRNMGRKCKSSVNDLLHFFSKNLEEQIHNRKYFYKSSILVKEGILNMLGQDFMSDLTDCEVEIDRRMLDFVVGLDTEFSEIVDGSHLYTPNVAIEDVILPTDIKEMVLETVSNFDLLKQVEKDLEVDRKITYGRGMTLLFYGTSGTGKTMLANALATHLNRRVLLINFPTLGTNEAGIIVKLIFREAKIHNAIIFFDECESLFQNRDFGSRNVNMILTELERHDGLSIMATNRPSDLDEAMYRRITLAVEFRKPDHILRERIWKSLCPPKLILHENVNLVELALKFELTGGFIKNTWLSALSFAVARDGKNPIVCQEDLRKAASHQLRGRLSMVDFDRRIVPTRGLDDIILADHLKQSLQDIVSFGKAQSILFGQWGFGKQHGGSKGVSALFTGPPGTGKTMAAEAVGYDLGRPLKVVNCAQLISKWVGESAKNIQAVFDEAKAVDAVLVFDEAESIFGARSDESSTSRHDNLNVGVLLHHMEVFSGVVVVITNMKAQIDSAFFRRFKFVLEFSKPSISERMKLWRLLIPAEAPLATDVDLAILAQRYDFPGGNIKSVVFRAASRAALRGEASLRVITMDDLKRAAEEEVDKEPFRASAAALSMYS